MTPPEYPEDELVGLNGDGDWSVLEGLSDISTGGVLPDIGVVGNLTDTLRLLVLAVSLLALVWVVSLEHEWCVLDVLESVVHETTVATVVLLGAVNELLLRE